MSQPITMGGSGASSNTNNFLANGANQAMAYAKKLINSLTLDNIPSTNSWAKVPGSWIKWIPRVTATGAMTISSLVVNSALYITYGPITQFHLDISFTTGGTADVGILIAPPTTSVGGVQTVDVVNAQTLAIALSYFFTPSSLSVVNTGGANWTLGAQHLFVSGSYQSS